MQKPSIEEIKRRLISKGYQEDELKSSFNTDEELEDFYYNVFLDSANFGNDLSKDADAKKDNYKLTVNESSRAKKIIRKKVKIIKTAVTPKSNEKVEEFKKAADHLGKDAGTLDDLDRFLKQLEDEDED